MKPKCVSHVIANALLLLCVLATLVPSSTNAQGPITSGETLTGNISTPGDSDSWTFSANVGDAIVVRSGQITDTNGLFNPQVRLLGPTGTQLGLNAGSLASEVAVTATNSGTFTVVVTDANLGFSGDSTNNVGTYRLTLAKTGDPVVVSPGDEGGPLSNGETHTGTTDTGDLDVWTFTANAGESFIVRMGEVTDANARFNPQVRVYGPTGLLLGSNQQTLAAEVAATATNAGTFTVVVGDANLALSGDSIGDTGTYRLTLAKSPGAFVVSAGDEGGALTNGATHEATITRGDLDMWSFTANAGEGIVLRMGQLTDTNNLFNPHIRLYSPTGVLLGSNAGGALASEVAVIATNSGTFTVVVSDADLAFSGDTIGDVGTYRLTLAHAPEAFVVSAGDEGGALSNGGTHPGTITVGDADLWSFSANTGDRIVVRVGEVTDDSSFHPQVRVYGPTGALLGSDAQFAASEVTVTASNTGPFTVVITDADLNSASTDSFGNTGTYRLHLAVSPGAFIVPGGDEGGAIANGGTQSGTIHLGDLDMWSFSANAGDSIIVRVGEVTDDGSFHPQIRVYGPTGVLVGSDSQFVASEVAVTVSNTGPYTVVVSDADLNSASGDSLGNTGTYRLHLAVSPGAFIVPGGDEGGALTNGATHEGTIHPGDLDMWNFAANAGDAIVIRMGQLIDTNNLFNPQIRLYGPNGALVGANSTSLASEVAATATNSGTYTVVVSDANLALGGDTIGNAGTYRLHLAVSPGAFVVSSGDEGGALTNGAIHEGAIHLGDLDMWSFTANAGDNMVIRCGQVTDDNGVFHPQVRLYGPTGVLLGSNIGTTASEVAVTATNSGTYTVVVNDGNLGFGGDTLADTGTYRLHLALSPGAFVISNGDEGGTLINGATQQGTIHVGDLDMWSFTAMAGESLVVRIGQVTDTNNLFHPQVRLYGPTGAFLGSNNGTTAAEVAVTATNSGTFTVVVGDSNLAFGGDTIGDTGTYQIHLARVRCSFVIGDEGGVLTNGATRNSTIHIGDLDTWEFWANAGDSISITMAQVTDDGNFNPWIRLYRPNGTLQSTVANASTAVVNVTVTNSGPFTIVASDQNLAFSGDSLGNTGTYTITMTGNSGAPPITCNLSPALATNVFGAFATATATVLTNNGPIACIAVSFNVISGPNVGESGEGLTDGGGATTFNYTGNGGLGTDVVQITGAVAGQAFTCTATRVWVAYPPGDVNGSFTVTGADSLLINQVLVGLRSNTHPIFAVTGFSNGDVNSTASVTGADSLFINQVIVGLRSFLVTRTLPGSHSSNETTTVTIFGIGFPTNGAVTGVTIGAPVNLTLSNVVVVSREQITAIVPPGGGLGTGTVSVAATSTNGVVSFGRFINH